MSHARPEESGSGRVSQLAGKGMEDRETGKGEEARETGVKGEAGSRWLAGRRLVECGREK